jgi:lysophospholipase L1-like esterase
MDINKIARSAVKLLLAFFIYSSFFIWLGETILRDFTQYGIEYYFSADVRNHNMSNGYVNLGVLKSLEEAKQNKGHSQDPRQLYRIIVIGDSIAAGGELEKGEIAFPKLIEKILQEGYPSVRFEVLTYAEGGYSTSEEVNGYEKYCKVLKPDLVVLAYCHNDTVEAYQKILKRNGKYFIAFYRTGIPYLKMIPFNRYFTEKFLTVRLINEFLIKSIYGHRYSSKIGFCLLADQKIYDNFKRLRILTRDSNTQVMVAVFPYLEARENRSRTRMRYLIENWCKELNFFKADILDTYKQYDYRKLRCRRTDPCHPNALGHSLAAEQIAESIKKDILFNLKK